MLNILPVVGLGDNRISTERTFGSQARWFRSKVLRYCGLAKAHAWHILQATAYSLKRLPKLYVDKQMQAQLWR
jgi:IS5 family transposase